MNFFKRNSNLINTEIVRNGESTVVLNYNRYLTKRSSKQALLCYLPEQIVYDVNNIKTERFSNEGIAREFPKALNQLGYSVDIISWNDEKFVPAKTYDLCIYHGAYNFKSIHSSLKSKTKEIHFLTGMYWKYNNAAETQRFADFKIRSGVVAPPDRFIYKDEDEVNVSTDGIILIGNMFTKSTYPEKFNVHPINNSVYPSTNPVKINSVSKVKKSYVFFAGAGNIHKGLDLVLEAFDGTNLELNVVTVLDKEVIKYYDKLISRNKNIHILGEIPVRSKEYYSLINKCGFCILPSCAEGQAGSLLECMLEGLIPVGTIQTGIDIDKVGFKVVPTIENIRQTVTKLSLLDDNILNKKSKAVKKYTLRNHSVKRFNRDLKKAITQITNS